MNTGGYFGIRTLKQMNELCDQFCFGTFVFCIETEQLFCRVDNEDEPWKNIGFTCYICKETHAQMQPVNIPFRESRRPLDMKVNDDETVTVHICKDCTQIIKNIQFPQKD